VPELCPDTTWPKGSDGNYLDGASDDCWVGSERSTADDGGADAFLQLSDVTTALCNVAIASWCAEGGAARGLLAWLLRLGVLGLARGCRARRAARH
jgi:hypothetical protein